ncbi:hypothetical protein [Specibacter sp. NPDC078692]|uniref:hypothetical protein n=1 Tax=Specibacter sp. NPDC078692 TaxID=3155818 RepID=UPI00344273DE
MDLATSVAFWSAIATACSAVFIGWQAWETRRTAQASRKAATDSRDAVKIANATLELATEQAQQSAILVKDSIRARLDIKAPAVSMTIRQKHSDTAVDFLIKRHDGPQAFGVMDFAEDALFELPRDNDTLIYAVYEVAFHNDGLVPVSVRSASMGSRSGGFFRWLDTIRVPVGESVNAVMAIGTSVEEWAMALDNKTPSPARGFWETVRNGETGVQLSQEFHVEAPMIQPVEGGSNGDTYRIPGRTRAPRMLASIVIDAQERAYVIAGIPVESLVPTVEEADMLTQRGHQPILNN